MMRQTLSNHSSEAPVSHVWLLSQLEQQIQLLEASYTSLCSAITAHISHTSIPAATSGPAGLHTSLQSFDWQAERDAAAAGSLQHAVLAGTQHLHDTAIAGTQDLQDAQLAGTQHLHEAQLAGTPHRHDAAIAGTQKHAAGGYQHCALAGGQHQPAVPGKASCFAADSDQHHAAASQRQAAGSSGSDQHDGALAGQLRLAIAVGNKHHTTLARTWHQQGSTHEQQQSPAPGDQLLQLASYISLASQQAYPNDTAIGASPASLAPAPVFSHRQDRQDNLQDSLLDVTCHSQRAPGSWHLQDTSRPQHCSQQAGPVAESRHRDQDNLEDPFYVGSSGMLHEDTSELFEPEREVPASASIKLQAFFKRSFLQFDAEDFAKTVRGVQSTPGSPRKATPLPSTSASRHPDSRPRTPAPDVPNNANSYPNTAPAPASPRRIQFQIQTDTGGQPTVTTPRTPARRTPSVLSVATSEGGDANELDLQQVRLTPWLVVRLVFWDVVHPHSYFRVWWDVLMFVAMFWIALITPLLVVFEENFWFRSGAYGGIEFGMDCLLFVDICLWMRTAKFTSNAHSLITRRTHVIRSYLTSWFILDAIACVPFLTVVNLPEDEYSERTLLLFRLLRLLKLLKLVHLPGKSSLRLFTERKLTKSKVLLHMMTLVAYALIAMHQAACYFYYIAVVESVGREEPFAGSWLAEEGLDDAPVFERYIAALYWALYTAMTVGYGDIYIHSVPEKICAICVMLLGLGLLTYFMGTLTTQISALNSSEQRVEETKQAVEEFIRTRHLKGSLARKVRTFYNYVSVRQLHDDDMEVLQGLSETLRTKVVSQLHKDMICNSAFFDGKPPHFITQLVMKLRMQYFSQGDFIVTQGSIGKDMYFIASGHVAVRTYLESSPDENPQSPSDVNLSDRRSLLYSGQNLVRSSKPVSPTKRPALKLLNRLPGRKKRQVELLPEVLHDYKTMGPGESFGEHTCLTGKVRSVSVVAITFCELYALGRDDLMAVVADWPELEDEFAPKPGQKRRASVCLTELRGRYIVEQGGASLPDQRPESSVNGSLQSLLAGRQESLQDVVRQVVGVMAHSLQMSNASVSKRDGATDVSDMPPTAEP